MEFDFLLETYDTERLKTLGVWAQFREGDLLFRPEPRARTPHEHMVHQCLSEHAWMTGMLDLQIDWPALPSHETRQAFLDHYAEASQRRLQLLRTRDAGWFLGNITFFDVARSRAWTLVRRFTHSAHHRGQLTAYLRMLGRPLYSTYGPTADTGGLPANGAVTIYPYRSLEALLDVRDAGRTPDLPGPGGQPPTERP